VTAVFAGLIYLGEHLKALDVVGIAFVVLAVLLQDRDTVAPA
jgi:threonine/homoserine efflux transporter RhtA